MRQIADNCSITAKSVYSYKKQVDPSTLTIRELESLLSPKQLLFCCNYLKYMNAAEAAKESGYAEKTAAQMGRNLLRDNKFVKEYVYRKQIDMQTATIADAQEILQYFTDVMRGEIKDQFGLDASLAERTKAAQELAKRQIDLPARLTDNDNSGKIEICLTRQKSEPIDVEYTELATS